MSGVASAADQEPAQAVILVSLDTLRPDYLNVYGYDRHETSPAIDAFAAEAVVFENSIVTEPWTLTSHMSLFTGLHPQRHGVKKDRPLAEDVDTLALLLRREGFRTGGFTDGGYVRPSWGFDRGFEIYFGAEPRGLRSLMADVKTWLALHARERFFLFLHTYDAHSKGHRPFYARPWPELGMFTSDSSSPLKSRNLPEFVERFRERQPTLSEVDYDYVRDMYAESVRHLDRQLGRFFDELRERELYDRSLIVLWSDHGEGLFDHADWSHGEMYDHTLRSVLIIKPPHSRSGRRERALISGVDLLPTLLELAGASIPEGLDGRSFAHLLSTPAEGAQPGRTEAFSVRTIAPPALFSIRTTRHHLIRDEERDAWHFFDLQHDPRERRDLSPSGDPEESRLRARLLEWIETQQAAARRAEGAPTLDLDPEIREQLEALGYAP
jgi:arylsulfatase A-like enzyme